MLSKIPAENYMSICIVLKQSCVNYILSSFTKYMTEGKLFILPAVVGLETF